MTATAMISSRKETSDVLVAYVTWNRIVPWKILSIPEDLRGGFFPIGYGSEQKALRRHCERGTKLYVVTLPWARLRGRREIRTYPLSLVARLEIRGVYQEQDLPAEFKSEGMSDLLRKWGWVAAAEPKSPWNRFYELNDVEGVFEDLGLITTTDLSSGSDKRTRVGSRLQSIRVLAGKDAEDAIRAFNRRLETRARRVFISFRSGKDNARYALALELAEQFLELGDDHGQPVHWRFRPWLDSHVIPLFKPRDDRSRQRLRNLIELGIRESDLAVELVSPDYALPPQQDEEGWTRFEHGLIARRRRGEAAAFRVAAIPLGVSEGDERLQACDAPVVPLEPVETLARRISAWYSEEF